MDSLNKYIKSQTIYNQIFEDERKKLDEMIKSKIYNLIMTEINEKNIIYSISTSNYKALFEKRGIHPYIALYFVDKLDEELKDYQLAIEKMTIELMIKQMES